MPKDEILDGSTWTDVQPQKEETLDGSTWTEVVKKKGLDDSKPTNTNLASPSLDGQSNGKLASSNDKKTTDFSFPDFSKQNIQGVTGTPVATQKQSKHTPKDVLGKGTTVKETTQTPIETPQYDVSGATKQQSDNTGTRIVLVFLISKYLEFKKIHLIR